MPMHALAILILLLSVPAAAVEAGQGTETGTTGNRVLEPVLNEKFDYYEVCGCSEKDLQCDLTAKAIKCDDGKKYDSVTNWKVSWDYGRRKQAETCVTEAYTVTVDVVFRLPRWGGDSKAPRQLVDKWDGYVRNILVHEYGHRDLALSAATDLTRTIAALPPARTCSELDREVDRISRARLKELLSEQAAYDKATGHGLSQGVAFP